MTEAAPEETQMTLFRPQDSVLAEKLRGLDLMNLTASQALALLEELKRFAEEE